METKGNVIRILLVEDDAELSAVTRMRLVNHGFEVVCALDGESALGRIKEEKFDVVLMDIILPDSDGHELCHAMRGEGIGFAGPIVFMSCMGDGGSIVEAFRGGGNDYIVKPAKMEVLLDRIAVNLENTKKDEVCSDRKWFKQFMVDYKTRTVYRVREHVMQEAIELSKTEYNILLVLISRPEEIFLYRQLYHAVWDMEDMGDVRTLMVHVSNLRKKIDEDRTDMIRSVRGVGYIFQDV